MNSSPDILRNTTDSRLAILEQRNVAHQLSTHVNSKWRSFNTVIARIENRIIEAIMMRRLKHACGLSGDENRIKHHLAQIRGAFDEGAMETLPSFQPTRLFSPVINDGVDMSPQGDPLTHSNRNYILYVPGGGFILPPSRRQKLMIQKLAQATNCEIFIANHRLAPEDPFPTAPGDVAAQYENLLNKGIKAHQIFLAADTAGASIGLGAVQLLQKKGVTLPGGIILFSPWCDLSLSGWSYITRSMTSQSPFRMESAAFCARLYLQENSATDPVASPIFADLTGWPPILIHTSKNDIHFDDAIRLAENGQQQGCDVKLNYWDSPRHHLERLSSKEVEQSFQEVRSFIRDI